MNFTLLKTTITTLAIAYSVNANAIICLANDVKAATQELYLANNCHYFSGSKELRIDRSGALFNYNNAGDYQDQLNGNSFIYCPIMGEANENNHISAEITVSDLNQQQDVICQMGKSSYTNKGFAAYWGETARSENVGPQTLKASTRISDHAKTMPNSFITCSLPPQNNADQKASSLVAYSVNKEQVLSKSFLSNK